VKKSLEKRSVNTVAATVGAADLKSGEAWITGMISA
jgi:hypothetical protein